MNFHYEVTNILQQWQLSYLEKECNFNLAYNDTLISMPVIRHVSLIAFLTVSYSCAEEKRGKGWGLFLLANQRFE